MFPPTPSPCARQRGPYARPCRICFACPVQSWCCQTASMVVHVPFLSSAAPSSCNEPFRASHYARLWDCRGRAPGHSHPWLCVNMQKHWRLRAPGNDEHGQPDQVLRALQVQKAWALTSGGQVSPPPVATALVGWFMCLFLVFSFFSEKGVSPHTTYTSPKKCMRFTPEKEVLFFFHT